jgi:hypothetical protein
VLQRHVTAGGSHTSLAQCVSEVTVLASSDATAATAVQTCADLDLGAHVAQMRTLAPPVGCGESPVTWPRPGWFAEALEAPRGPRPLSGEATHRGR